MASEMVTLISSNGQQLKVSVHLANQSPIIAHGLQQHDGDDPPTFSINVHSDILPEIITYWEIHVQEEPESRRRENEIRDAEFLEKMDIPRLAGVIEAAHNLEMTKLLDLTCQRVADMIKGKTVEEMREILNIQNDYTKEEEDQYREDFAWAFRDFVPDEQPKP